MKCLIRYGLLYTYDLLTLYRSFYKLVLYSTQNKSQKNQQPLK